MSPPWMSSWIRRRGARASAPAWSRPCWSGSGSWAARLSSSRSAVRSRTRARQGAATRLATSVGATHVRHRAAPDARPVRAGTGRLGEALAAAQRRAAGYTIVRWVDGAADADVADLAELMALMSTDSPQGDLEVEPEVWDAARYRGEGGGHRCPGPPALWRGRARGRDRPDRRIQRHRRQPEPPRGRVPVGHPGAGRSSWPPARPAHEAGKPRAAPVGLAADPIRQHVERDRQRPHGETSTKPWASGPSRCWRSGSCGCERALEHVGRVRVGVVVVHPEAE